MQILNIQPPNFDEIAKVLDIRGGGLVFTYGNIIYNPDGGEIGADIIAHESIHAKQQGADPQSWWDKYLTDPKFRVKQEVEAYHEHYRYFKNRIGDRNVVARYHHGMAVAISSSAYGRVIGYPEALKAIRTGKYE